MEGTLRTPGTSRTPQTFGTSGISTTLGNSRIFGKPLKSRITVLKCKYFIVTAQGTWYLYPTVLSDQNLTYSTNCYYEYGRCRDRYYAPLLISFTLGKITRDRKQYFA